MAIQIITHKKIVWIEDRMEHLTASSSATGRLTKIKASVSKDGLINAIAYSWLLLLEYYFLISFL